MNRPDVPLTDSSQSFGYRSRSNLALLARSAARIFGPTTCFRTHGTEDDLQSIREMIKQIERDETPTGGTHRDPDARC